MKATEYFFKWRDIAGIDGCLCIGWKELVMIYVSFSVCFEFSSLNEHPQKLTVPLSFFFCYLCFIYPFDNMKIPVPVLGPFNQVFCFSDATGACLKWSGFGLLTLVFA